MTSRRCFHRRLIHLMGHVSITVAISIPLSHGYHYVIFQSRDRNVYISLRNCFPRRNIHLLFRVALRFSLRQRHRHVASFFQRPSSRLNLLGRIDVTVA